MQKRRLEDIVSKPRPGGQGGVPMRPVRENPTPPPVTLAPRARRMPPATEPPHHEPRTRPMRPEQELRTRRRRRGFPWLPTAIVASVVVIGTAFALSLLFSGATVTVHPRQEQSFIDGTFVAAPEAGAGQLGYKLLSVEETATEAVTATGEEEVEERAAGRITIYNEFDEEPQRLIKNTRFEAADGKIFRIQDSVNVPGATPKGDGTFTPGTVEANVFADEPGESYNLAPGRFTIPGFSGTPRYEKFYALSTEAMAGGFKGVKRVVAEEQEAAVRASLTEKLRTTLAEKSVSDGQKPEDQYLYKNAIFYRFDPLPSTPEGDDKVTIGVRGTAYAVLFNKDEFAKFIASQAVAGYDNELVTLRNPDDITVTTGELPSDASSTPPWEGGTVSVTISGTAHIVWNYDQQTLRNDLAGRETAALETILQGYPGIERATVVHRPFWKNTFPESPEDIEVIESLD